jgi:hypothetical protein
VADKVTASCMALYRYKSSEFVQRNKNLSPNYEICQKQVHKASGFDFPSKL